VIFVNRFCCYFDLFGQATLDLGRDSTDFSAVFRVLRENDPMLVSARMVDK
jgi:hypothetical protein